MVARSNATTHSVAVSTSLGFGAGDTVPEGECRGSYLGLETLCRQRHQEEPTPQHHHPRRLTTTVCHCHCFGGPGATRYSAIVPTETTTTHFKATLAGAKRVVEEGGVRELSGLTLAHSVSCVC